MTFFRHLLAILVLPTTVTVVVPYYLLTLGPPRPTAWTDWDPVRITATLLGLCALALGFALVGSTIQHFATIGRGTLAPWDPPKRLVIAGVYRYVRNPMISGVLLILLGETLVFGSARLLRWFLLFFAINATYIPLWEEASLARRFGDDYREYKRHVRRWIPRRTAWEPPWGQG